MVEVGLGLGLPEVDALWEGRGCPCLSRQIGGGGGEEREMGGLKAIGRRLKDGWCGG